MEIIKYKAKENVSYGRENYRKGALYHSIDEKIKDKFTVIKHNPAKGSKKAKEE